MQPDESRPSGGLLHVRRISQKGAISRAESAATHGKHGKAIPGVIVSPRIPPGSIIRPPEGGPPFDHTSIIKTLRKLFRLGIWLCPVPLGAPVG